MECLPDTLVELVVGDGTPEGRLAVGDGLQVWGDRPGRWVRGLPSPCAPGWGPLDALEACFPTSQGIIIPPTLLLCETRRIQWDKILRCWEKHSTGLGTFY